MTNQHEPPSVTPPVTPPAPDWSALYASAAFRELATARARFVRWASGLVLAWFAVFLLVVGLTPGLAGQQVGGGVTVGFLLGLSQFVVAWLVTWRYLATSRNRFDPLERRVLRSVGDTTSEVAR